MSAAREWSLAYDRSSAGAMASGPQKSVHYREYFEGSAYEKTSLSQKHQTQALPAVHTVPHTLYSGEAVMLSHTQRSAYASDYGRGSSRLSQISSLTYKTGSTTRLTLDDVSYVPDAHHPEGVPYHRSTTRDQDHVVSQQDTSTHVWPGYSSRHGVRDQSRRVGQGLTTNTRTLDLTTMARSTPVALEEFLRPTDSITFPSTHHSHHDTHMQGGTSRKEGRGLRAATSWMDRSYSEPLQDDVPCRDQTEKAALCTTDSMPLQGMRPSGQLFSSNQSWTIGTAWAAGRPVQESRRPFAQEDTTRTIAPLSWLLNDDIRSTSSSSSSSSSSASSDSGSRSSNSASLWLSDCHSLCSDGSGTKPQLMTTEAPTLPGGRSSSCSSMTNDARYLSGNPSNNVDLSLPYKQVGGYSSQFQQRYLLRPWLSATELHEGKATHISSSTLHAQPAAGTCTQRIMQELLGEDAGCKSESSSSSSWLSDTRGSRGLPAPLDDQLLATSTLCSAKQLMSPTMKRSPSQYQDLSCPLALELANELLACIKLPGNFQYVPVSEDSPLYMLGVVYEFTAFDVALGSTYYQRLRHGFGNSSLLMDRLLGSPQIPGQARLAPVRRYLRQEHLSQLARKQAFLSVLQYISLLLAAKILGSRTDLSSETLRMHISRAYQMHVQLEKAVDVEVLCLQKLQWRLGPFLEEDQLSWLSSLEWL